MHFEVLATDYDGTLAQHGLVAPSTIAALERLRASGRRLLMVTGRELEDLRLVFSRFDLFDLIVGENGAVLYYPATERIKCLRPAPPRIFADVLRHRGIKPLSVGHVIVATQETNHGVVLEVIKQLDLPLEIILNKGSLMILPIGVNKATGLAVALRELGLARDRTVGIGDAENDQTFLTFCGCGVAVSNALPSLKRHADLVTTKSHGEGVAELIDLLIATDLSGIVSVQPRLALT
jgi:hydroxymethylpyrimidine pyrophosphatase-like HAD family hydrolase